MQREEVRTGSCVRLQSDWHRIPADTTGIVDEIGTMTDSRWYCFVQFGYYRDIPLYAIQHPEGQQWRVHTKRALFWEDELNLFEIITAEERVAAIAAFVELHLMCHGSRIPE